MKWIFLLRPGVLCSSQFFSFCRNFHLKPVGNVGTNNWEARCMLFKFVGRNLSQPNTGLKRFIAKHWVTAGGAVGGERLFNLGPSPSILHSQALPLRLFPHSQKAWLMESTRPIRLAPQKSLFPFSPPLPPSIVLTLFPYFALGSCSHSSTPIPPTTGSPLRLFHSGFLSAPLTRPSPPCPFLCLALTNIFRRL